MKKILVVCFTLMMTGCLSLKDPSVRSLGSLSGYKYVLVNPTGTVFSYTESSSNNEEYYSSDTKAESVCPADVITGHLLKAGYVPIDEITPDIATQSLVVNYGESDRDGWGRIEVVVQIVAAQTDEVLCIATAEGHGGTEASTIRNALNRCMNEIFR